MCIVTLSRELYLEQTENKHLQMQSSHAFPMPFILSARDIWKTLFTFWKLFLPIQKSRLYQHDFLQKSRTFYPEDIENIDFNSIP